VLRFNFSIASLSLLLKSLKLTYAKSVCKIQTCQNEACVSHDVSDRVWLSDFIPGPPAYKE